MSNITYEDFLDIIKAQAHIKTRFDVVTHFTGYNGTFTTQMWEFTVMAFEDGYLTA